MFKNILFGLSIVVILAACTVNGRSNDSHGQAQKVKVTILSTMLSDYKGIGEWGFAALVEVDGNRLLFDTGAHPETVLNNARDLGIDLATVEDVFLSHNHWDHVGGLLTLRRMLMQENPKALSRAHVGKGIFLSRPQGAKEDNKMIAIKTAYEKLGGTFIVYDKPRALFDNVWITGPVPRVYPEKNWNGNGKIVTDMGLQEDIIPEDMSLAINTAQGWVMVSGCGHSGIINTMEYIQNSLGHEPVYAAIGGFHLYKADNAHLQWTTEKMKAFGVKEFLGAHCTGINATFIIRNMMGMDRKTAVIGAVGNVFELSSGIDTGNISR